MKLRTSYFNGTVFKKDILRFAPVWSLYAIFLFLIFSTIGDLEPARVGNDVADLMTAMAWINLFYGGICANILFGDLFNPRMCNALHAMPMRREGWFLTHLLAGFLFSLVPNLLGTGLLCAMLGKYYYLALLWLAVMTLQFLFFFGIGTFSMMCAGNRLAMAAVYLIINFFSMLVFVLADQFYEPLLYGIRVDSAVFESFCPLFLSTEDYILFSYDKILGGVFEGFCWETWYDLFGLAALGVVLLAAAVLLYRHRRLECAGDFLALRPLEPVFLIIYTLGVGVAMYGSTTLFGLSGSYVFMGIGIVVGFFTGRMLLERSVKVFRPKVFLGFAVFAVILTGSLILAKLDPMGITWYVPETEEIEFMRVYRDNDAYYYNDPADSERACYQLETVEQIEQFRNLHIQLQQERDNKYGELCQVEVMYQLKDGSTVLRYYSVDENSPVRPILQSYFSTPEYLLCTDDVDAYIKAIGSIELDLSFTHYLLSDTNVVSLTDPEDIQGLMQALVLDCEAGNMAQDYAFHPNEDYMMWIFIDTSAPEKKNGVTILETGRSYRDIVVYPCCENTVAYVEEFLETYEVNE